MSLLIEEPGLFSTLQDLGRNGFMRIGVPPSGALDPLALRAANAVLGQDQAEAALEMCRLGITAVVEAESLRFALTGAEAPASLNGRPIAFWRSHLARRGQRLAIGRIAGGAAYLAVQGGFAVPAVMGSLSTYARAGIGGFHGRRLAAGDRLPLRLPEALPGPDFALPHPVPAERGRPLRVILGPQEEMFTDAAIRCFLTEPWTVTRDADRIGLRLAGPRLAHAGAAEIVSDANTTGCIQVPGDGQPIVLLPDRQSVGGYPKIATVITADLHRLGQAVPGSVLRFEAVAPEQAEAALWLLERAAAETFAARRPV
ncbi:MAG: biotin-dependent carboxyltransferase family protein [Rhodovarius sp.]|nr:biotin-dependent carboxyltransferase family protein [Rhodovarius sp.]